MTTNRNWQEYSDNSQYQFPGLEQLDTKLGDLITVGADLEISTLINAYTNGYFPMEVSIDRKNKTTGWFSPKLRGIIPIDKLHVTKSMRRSYKNFTFEIDNNFENIMRKCMETPRKGGWINERYIEKYHDLYNAGFAHSVEVYSQNELVGGLYGVSIGGLFAGESMFSLKSDASKVALMKLIEILKSIGAKLLDTQWLTPHLKSLGAVVVPREKYGQMLKNAIAEPSTKWTEN